MRFFFFISHLVKTSPPESCQTLYLIWPKLCLKSTVLAFIHGMSYIAWINNEKDTLFFLFFFSPKTSQWSSNYCIKPLYLVNNLWMCFSLQLNAGSELILLSQSRVTRLVNDAAVLSFGTKHQWKHNLDK